MNSSIERSTTRLDYVGSARAAVLVIEDLDSQPQSLVDAAAALPSFDVRAPYYPGIRAPAPRDYLARLVAQLRPLVEQSYGWRDAEIIEANFSLVTTPPEALVPYQRIPHVDGTDPDELAVLHYLCGPEKGGTSFYRHRSTGLEVLSPENIGDYAQAVNREVRENGIPPARYVDGETPLFDCIARYEARFNRALVYRGSSLHSGNIPATFVPDANPRTGRLTVNTFLRRTA
jgi:Family of unknown function (DUF6445)